MIERRRLQAEQHTFIIVRIGALSLPTPARSLINFPPRSGLVADSVFPPPYSNTTWPYYCYNTVHTHSPAPSLRFKITHPFHNLEFNGEYSYNILGKCQIISQQRVNNCSILLRFYYRTTLVAHTE